MNQRTLLRFTTLPVIIAFVFSALGPVAGSADGIESKQRSWGLTPFHIDRGLDRLELEDSTRQAIDLYAEIYYGLREGMRDEIISIRRAMVASIASGEKEGLQSMRLSIRGRMSAMRSAEEEYVALVAALLDDENISTLLDFELAWGE